MGSVEVCSRVEAIDLFVQPLFLFERAQWFWKFRYCILGRWTSKSVSKSTFVTQLPTMLFQFLWTYKAKDTIKPGRKEASEIWPFLIMYGKPDVLSFHSGPRTRFTTKDAINTFKWWDKYEDVPNNKALFPMYKKLETKLSWWLRHEVWWHRAVYYWILDRINVGLFPYWVFGLFSWDRRANFR